MKYEKLRYQPNKISQTLTLLGMVFMSYALFRVINVYRFNNSQVVGIIKADIWVGIEILVAISAMLLSFLASEKFKTYDKTWVIVGTGLSIYSFSKIFFYPIKLYRLLNDMIANGEPVKYNPTTWLISVIIALIIAGTLYATATYITYVKANQLATHFKELKSHDETR